MMEIDCLTCGKKISLAKYLTRGNCDSCYTKNRKMKDIEGDCGENPRTTKQKKEDEELIKAIKLLLKDAIEVSYVCSEKELKDKQKGEYTFNERYGPPTHEDIKRYLLALELEIEQYEGFLYSQENIDLSEFYKLFEEYDISSRMKDNILWEIPRIEFLKEVVNNKFDVDKIARKEIENRIKEYETKKLKRKQRTLEVKKKAQKEFYGKDKSSRTTLSKDEKDIVFGNYNNECAICNEKEGLHIHHKDKNAENNDPQNLILLCGVCHKKIHMKVR